MLDPEAACCLSASFNPILCAHSRSTDMQQHEPQLAARVAYIIHDQNTSIL